ncbi:MAG: hypothetical protein AAF604_06140 [Acidobacteriota bacterium]
MSAGLLGVGHHHADEEAHEEHRCDVCPASISATEPSEPLIASPFAATLGLIGGEAIEEPPGRSPRRSPPLRGPPAD